MFSPYSIDFYPLEDFHKKKYKNKTFFLSKRNNRNINQGKLFCILAAIKITRPAELQS